MQIEPAALPFNENFLAWLREEKKSGRKIILATASDLKMAQPVADFAGIFDEVLASDGQTNLRSENKLRALTEKFGERGFDYAGNSSADFAVWRGARQAVVVNASPRVLREAANCTQPGPTFCEDYSPLSIARSVATELFWRSGYLIAIFAGLLLALAFPKFCQSERGGFRVDCARALARRRARQVRRGHVSRRLRLRTGVLAGVALLAVVHAGGGTADSRLGGAGGVSRAVSPARGAG